MSPDDQMTIALRVLHILGLLFLTFIIAVWAYCFWLLAKFLRAMREPAGWPTATGRVLAADIQAREVFSPDGESSKTVGSFPHIVYEYEVAGKVHIGERFKAASALTQMPNYRIAETLNRYPVGTEVQVRYDPVHPNNAVLEVEPLFRVILGATGGILILGFGPWLMLGPDIKIKPLFQRLVPLIQQHFPEADPGLMMEAGGLALVIGLGGSIWLWRVLLMRCWPVTNGQILSSQVEGADANYLSASTLSTNMKWTGGNIGVIESRPSRRPAAARGLRKRSLTATQPAVR